VVVSELVSLPFLTTSGCVSNGSAVPLDPASSDRSKEKVNPLVPGTLFSFFFFFFFFLWDWDLD
jgi:hypothetical protein